MTIDLTPAPWMIFPGLVAMIAVSAGVVCFVDWLCNKYSKVDRNK